MRVSTRPPTNGTITSPAPPDPDGSGPRGLPGPAGGMQAIVYDPQAVLGDAFDLTNHTGVIDAGEFF